jgi:hypothetical protein
MTFSYLVDVNAEYTTKDARLNLNALYTFLRNTSVINTLCAKFISINTSLWLVDCTNATCCEKREVPTTSSQKMSLKPHSVSFSAMDPFAVT